MQEYVMGVAQTRNHKYVLIQKNRPESLRGKLNFVGGKIEKNEQPLDAMVREFKEETGVITAKSKWALVGSLNKAGKFIVHVFTYKENSNIFAEVETTTDEHVFLVSEEDICNGIYNTAPNVRWIVNFLNSPDHIKYHSAFMIEYKEEVGQEYGIKNG